mgnify:FL=1
MRKDQPDNVYLIPCERSEVWQKTNLNSLTPFPTFFIQLIVVVTNYLSKGID